MKQLLLKIKSFLDTILDKVAHYGIGLTIGMIVSFCQSNDIWGYMAICLITAVIGLFKESFDIYTGKDMDWKDILATVVGGIVFCIYWYLI